MAAYDGANTLVATSSCPLNAALVPLSVTATSIKRVVLSGSPIAVFDDLRFTPGGIVPTASTSWGRLKAYYR